MILALLNVVRLFFSFINSQINEVRAMTSPKISPVVLMAQLILLFGQDGSAQVVSGWNRRPTIGEDQAMWDKWWRLTPEERQRNNAIFQVDASGNRVRENRPGLDADRLFRDAYGNSFRYVDLPPLYEKQDAAIQAQRDKLKAEQDAINETRRSSQETFFNARDAERQVRREGEQLKDRLVSEAEERYSTDNFTCSEGNSWDVCVNHPNEKLTWLQQRRNAVTDAQARAASSTQQRVIAAVRQGNEARRILEQTNNQARQLNQNVDTLGSAINRQNSGELWLFPGGKSPLASPNPGPQ